jgi:hypothetical protein
LWDKAQIPEDTQINAAADEGSADSAGQLPPTAALIKSEERINSIKHRAQAILQADNSGESIGDDLRLDDVTYEYTATNWPERP